MHSLLYVSTSCARFDDSDLADLAGQAARANARAGVTGLLAYNGRSFMQLLEGTESAVRSVMDRIAADPRHRDIVYLRTDDRDARECPDWAMRELLVPLTGAGSATRFTATLPDGMEPDTRLLFTSFASVLRPLVPA